MKNELFEESAARHSVVLVLFFVAILQFFGLGASEVQPWDEGLFAVRAESIHSTDSFIDQTDGSLGGLYSATYPPLSVWMIRASFAAFGHNPFALRLFSVLCSGFGFALVYLILRRKFEKEYSLAGSLVLASALSWQFYSRQGMTDVPLTVFILLSLYGLLVLSESSDFRRAVLGGLVFTVGFAAALMTKIVISFIPILFVIAFVAQRPGAIRRNTLIFFALLGIAIAIPWHAFMAMKHGIDFVAAFAVPHVFSAVENNTRSSGVFYYANQLVSASPFLAISCIAALVYIPRRRKILAEQNETARLFTDIAFWWFALGIVFFSISSTKMPHYAVYLLPPAIILAVDFVKNSKRYIRSGEGLVLATILFACGVVWSFTVAARPELKQNLYSPMYLFPIAGFLIGVLILLGGIANGRFRWLTQNSTIVLRNTAAFVLLVCLVRITMMNVLIPTGDVSGAREIGDLLLESKFEKFVYVYHEHNAADSLNPQLNWYMVPRKHPDRQRLHYIPMPLSAGLARVKEIYETDSLPSLPIVYYLSNDRDVAEKVIRELAETRPLIERTRNYALFGKKSARRQSAYLLV